MAWINRISITLCVLLFTTLSLTPMAHVSKQARESSATTHITKKANKKKNAAATQKTQKANQKTVKEAASKSTTKSKTTSSVKEFSIIASKSARTHSEHAINETASTNFTEKCTKCKGYKSRCVKAGNIASGVLADAYKAKVQKATKVAMNKLVQQIGKPYRWGGSSPCTGFNCSDSTYYTYKDLVKIYIPRTANEMYRLRDTAPIERSELEDNDLVFFRTQGCSTADHVGVYTGDDRFVQSPRMGQGTQITSLSEGHRQRRCVDTRRVMIPKTLR